MVKGFVETRNLVRVFGGKNEVVKALDGVSVSIDEGEIFGLLGPNGAGKTTMIKVLTTLLLPTSGEAYVGGFDVVKDSNRVRQIINLVSGGETPGYGILSVKENLWFFSQLYGLSSSVANEKIKRLMADLDFEQYANTRMAKLSTGYKQRMSLARGLLSDPRMLFLDEPTLGLDVLTAKRLRNYVIDWAKRQMKGTVLLTTHYMAEADEMCDRVAIINNGRILACDSPNVLKENLKETPIAKIEVSSVQADFGFIEKMQGVVGYSETRNIQTGITSLKVMVRNVKVFANIESKLNEEKLKILSVNETEPTLEDVYIRLVGKGFADVEEKTND
ncbi:MAG TPA: ABC transporter ATP-binding protein [Candidatus Bathyarchaeia archaeon]|jgi:ABC-2 type transport system ATP-binding protein|nr:ABC transporter ATP-binding protein [Candidatus Bathyarchaeia archaeon]